VNDTSLMCELSYRWGLKEADEKLKKWAPTRLYNSVKLCSFCAQVRVHTAFFSSIEAGRRFGLWVC
jgi:hypothetical protein